MRIDQVSFPGQRGRKEVRFLFDDGDQWHVGVKLVRTSEAVTADVTYPRIVASTGALPPQYADLDDDWDDDADAEDEEV